MTPLTFFQLTLTLLVLAPEAVTPVTLAGTFASAWWGTAATAAAPPSASAIPRASASPALAVFVQSMGSSFRPGLVAHVGFLPATRPFSHAVNIPSPKDGFSYFEGV